MEWIVAAAIFAAGVLSGYTIKVVIDVRSKNRNSNNKASSRENSVTQSGNKAGGHIAVGDITTRK